jgi:hypothetical protein
VWKSAFIGGVAVAVLGATCGEALAKSVCYQTGRDVDGFLRLDVRRHGVLTSSRERRTFDSPVQTTYSVQGTSISQNAAPPAPPVVAPISGTVTVARGTGSIADFTVPELFVSSSVAFTNCWSDDASATPETWQCRILILFPTEAFGPESATLTRVDPLDEPLCSAFTLPEEEPTWKRRRRRQRTTHRQSSAAFPPFA